MKTSRATSPDPAGDRPSTAARGLRETALNEARRALILDAARSAFLELGLDGASLREIAKRAGYTPGALYSHFGSREDIYAALLGESLLRLQHCIDDAAAPVADAAGAPDRPATLACLRATALAFFGYYRDHPQDMDLGFYLFNGARPRGLTSDLNQQLNDRLRNALRPMQHLLVRLGLTEQEALIETTAIFAHVTGVLMLRNTGRIRLFGQDAQALMARHLDQLSARLEVRA